MDFSNWLAPLTTVHELYSENFDSLRTDRIGKGWSPENVYKIKEEILCLKKVTIEVFKGLSDTFLHTLKFYLFGNGVEDFKILETFLFCRITRLKITISM